MPVANLSTAGQRNCFLRVCAKMAFPSGKVGMGFFNSYLILFLSLPPFVRLVNQSMKLILAVICCLLSTSLFAQLNLNPFKDKKLYQRNDGAIIGLQRGSGVSLELGYEAHWRKISWSNPTIVGATGNLEYDFTNNVMGYKLGAWMKRGRVNLTYGANLVYFSDFKEGSKYGINPVIGFRLAGFHFINGYNLLAGSGDFKNNTLYVSLRYYFPVHNRFVWDRKTQKIQEQKRKDREERKKQREEERKGKTGIRKWLNL